MRRLNSLVYLLLVSGTVAAAEPLERWQPSPADWKGATVADGFASLTGDPWSWLRSPGSHQDFELSAQVKLTGEARRLDFFGQSWSVWPDRTFGDGGFEAGLFLRAGTNCGYRVQLSHKYQVIALVKWPQGGYVQVVPCEIKLNHPHRLQAQVQGNRFVVQVDGVEKIRWVDAEKNWDTGGAGLGVSSQAKVEFREVSLTQLPDIQEELPEEHVPLFSVRPFLGGRPWVFDGDEPILLLPSPESSYINNVKLRPGHKPQLSWNSHWDTQNQGAYKEAENQTAEVRTSGGGNSLIATWRGQHTGNRFGTNTTLTVGFDKTRHVYTYDVASELEVFAGEPFHFRYGYDFEHHTPLDPFNWQYLIARRKNGELYHRPVYPIDPGPQNDLETYQGLRVWYGRHNGDLQVAPAVEYQIEPEGIQLAQPDGSHALRTLNTAVCAAFYDTGVSFAPETAPPGTKIRVKYRYTGYPVAEARRLFEQSKIYDSPTLDPRHHYIFADEWPTLTFSQFVPMSETWIYGRTPFMTAHNTRPSYELVKNCGAGSGFAMQLGPAAYGKATLSKSGPLAQGRYVVTALVKADNIHGPGGRLELEVLQAKTDKPLTTATHYIGNGTFDWRKQGFAFEVPEDGAGLSLAFGNAGTGQMLVTEVTFRRLEAGEEPPAAVLSQPHNQPAKFPPAPTGAVADYRMLEGTGYSVFNHATGGLGHLDLANLDFVTDQGRPALRFADNVTGRKDYRLDGGLFRSYLNHPAYAERNTLPLAVSGHHGGGSALPGLTLAAWIKPAAAMGQSAHGGKGDVIGYGARRFILGLLGQEAPYQLTARINVNDTITAAEQLEADRWYHVALTAEPAAGQWQVRLYLDGKQVAEGRTQKFPADSVIPPSLILGAELFYFHDAYYRGLIGRTVVLERRLTAEEIQALRSEP